MTIFIDILNNAILFLKGNAPLYKKEYDYSLSIFDNKVKAIYELQNDEGFKMLNKGKGNDLVLSDDLVGFGNFDVPTINKRNEKDIFLTQFRLAFPNYLNYYVSSFELSRSDKHVNYLYSFMKIEYLDILVSAFNNVGVDIANKNTFNQLVMSNGKNNNPYPRIFLVIGKYNSEIFITKGNNIIANNFFSLGEEELDTGNEYLYSAYNRNNKEALSFSGFIKNSLSSNKDVHEDEILAFDSDSAVKYNEPKQIRLLRDQSLKQFLVKNNYKKYYSRIIDFLNYYKGAPYFIPVNNTTVISSLETFNNLNEISKEDNTLSLTHNEFSYSLFNNQKINNNPLFSSRLKQERRKIDWKAFFNMEIGKKKKA